MEVQKFKEELQKVNGLSIGDYIVFNDYELYNLKTNKEKQFNSFEELLNHKIRGITIENIIKNIDEFNYNLAGGRGASGSQGSGSLFKGQHQNHKDNSKYDIPAKMNKMYGGNKMSFDNTLKNFKNAHLLSDKEHAVGVDKDGFVQIYKHGNKGSVGWNVDELAGKHIIHNHPSDGYSAFSKADLITTATTKATGITATSSQYDYVFNKKHNFDAKGFVKAVNTASGTGNYNEDVHKFLKSNAKKYGYSYYRKSNSKITSNMKLDKKANNKLQDFRKQIGLA